MITEFLKKNNFFTTHCIKNEADKKSRFLLELNESGRFATDFVRLFLNAVLLNQSIQALIKIYGQSAIFCLFVRKFLTIMMRIYGQKAGFGAFVRKTEVETSKILRTKGYF